MRRLTSPFLAAATGAVVAAIVVGGVAIAQTSTSTVITACVAENTGNVRIVPGRGDCKVNETSTTWNQQGPQGLPGPAGANGVSGWTQVQGETTVVGSQRWESSTASCPDGRKVLGGGLSSDYLGDIRTTPYVLTLLASEPAVGGGAWYVRMLNDTPMPLSFTPYAICATVL